MKHESKIVVNLDILKVEMVLKYTVSSVLLDKRNQVLVCESEDHGACRIFPKRAAGISAEAGDIIEIAGSDQEYRFTFKRDKKAFGYMKRHHPRFAGETNSNIIYIKYGETELLHDRHVLAPYSFMQPFDIIRKKYAAVISAMEGYHKCVRKNEEPDGPDDKAMAEWNMDTAMRLVYDARRIEIDNIVKKIR